MRIPLVIFGAAMLAAPVARADVLVKNRDGHKHAIRIIHVVGRTSTEIPRGESLLISGSEEATAIQLEDKEGNAIGKPVKIADGDKVTIASDNIRCEHDPNATE